MRIAIATCLLLAIPAVASAQPACRPAAESPLARLEGFWLVDWSYRLSPGNFLETQGTAVVTKDVFGCALIEHFSAAIDTVPYVNLTMFSQPAEGQLDRVTIDSQHGGILKHDGRVAGDSLVFEWQIDLGSRLLRTRHIYLFAGPDTFTKEQYLSPANDSPWELRQRAVYRRLTHSGN